MVTSGKKGIIFVSIEVLKDHGPNHILIGLVN